MIVFMLLLVFASGVGAEETWVSPSNNPQGDTYSGGQKYEVHKDGTVSILWDELENTSTDAEGDFYGAEISPVGSKIIVENYECETLNERTISCQNIGRICQAARRKEKEQTAYYLGCALEEWKSKHPGESCPDPWVPVPPECVPLQMY